METVNTVQGALDASDLRVAVVASRFNEFVVKSLVDGAIEALRRHGARMTDVKTIWVPGAFELPLVVKKLAAGRRYDAIIALGAVIRGATPHFDYVAGECVKGLAQIMLQHETPIGFGVLTVDSIEQAIERAGTKAGNKGEDAAVAAIEMANLIRRLD